VNLQRLHALGLRRLLLLLLVPGLVVVGAAEVWQTWRTAVGAANAAYDRSLFGAIKSIDANVSTASGGVGVELPYRLLEFFELTANGHVYYRVTTENRLVDIGNADLPLPPGRLVTGQPKFTDALYFDERVRVGTYARPLDPKLAGSSPDQRLVIQVAETLESRQAFTRALVLEAVARDTLLLIVAMGLMAAAVGWALRPLSRLRREVLARDVQDLTPISAQGIPADVQPLVDAINFHVERSRQDSLARQHFVDDASHQLRTPLTTLATQVGYALREPNPELLREALVAIKIQLDETVRQTNQMLALARVDSAAVELETIDVTSLAEKVTSKWWPEARANGVDLGFEPDTQPLVLKVQPAMLQEAIANLLHNAIRYTARGTRITVKLRRSDSHGLLAVIDNGAGMPPDELARLGDRFFRGSNALQPGSGLGLAIVRSIAHRLGGQLHLGNQPDGRGFKAVIALPLPLADTNTRGLP
jgi:two-component system, OmpR family, sensor histidine kinase TctE